MANKAVTEIASSSVNYNTKNMHDLRKARTGKEFRGVMESIISTATSIKIPERFAELSVSARAISLDDLEARPAKVVQKLNLADTIDLSSIDIADIKNKAKYNGQVSILTQAIAELHVAYQILKSRTFTGFKDSENAANRLNSVIEESRKLQNDMVKLMSIDVKSGTPPEHKRLAATIANYLSKILSKDQYNTISSRTFIAQGTDPIVFQTLVHVSDFVNSEGTFYPHYSMVLSTSVSVATGAAQHMVTSLVDDKVPGSFPMGTVVKTAPELKKAMNKLLSIDGFLNYDEKLPIPKSTQQLRDTSMLGSTEHLIKGRKAEILDSIRVQNDFLYVKLVRGLTPKERQDAIQEVLAIATAALRGRSKNRLTYTTAKGRNGAEFIKIALTKSSGQADGTLTVAEIDKLGSMLHLNKAQIRMLKQSVK